MANENINENEQVKQIDLAQIINNAFGIFRNTDKETKENLNVLIIGKTGVGKSTLNQYDFW